MGESQHTAGPWEWQGVVEEGDERGCAFVIGSNLGGLVGAAMCWPTEYESGDFSRVEANARLIAAAPELLDIAKRYAEFVRHHVKAADIEMHPYLPEMEAVIAKATGAA